MIKSKRIVKAERKRYNELMKKGDPAYYKKFIEPRRRHDTSNKR